MRATFTMEVKLRGGILERLLSLGAYYCVENISEGRERWDVLLDSAKVREVVPTIRTVAEELRVFRREFDPLLSAKGRLTSREEEVLRLAVRRGYFEWPREVGLAELASELGVTRTAVLQILRKAMKKVAESYAEAF
ncbi:hypothetical protein HS1genome_1984 [Sulfodiicoccus acidiphilus]|uniref:HTH bat-type domain-containing protein n=1 Tax=Sulfodiicoccus acidiphilus TaxID=1670455 RepID=A0A348B5Z3_9CREN|nr:helix-turn-helix domain-containing protein [Sulfodiicoccus acidiphilus]BBD73595.1 hypothetical protein HS1genome_1984 [Sulfodiicoccus acidiphilus]